MPVLGPGVSRAPSRVSRSVAAAGSPYETCQCFLPSPSGSLHAAVVTGPGGRPRGRDKGQTASDCRRFHSFSGPYINSPRPAEGTELAPASACSAPGDRAGGVVPSHAQPRPQRRHPPPQRACVCLLRSLMQQPVPPHGDQRCCTREERQKNACGQVADLRSDLTEGR